MPTLSQFKILSHLLSKQARARHAVAERNGEMDKQAKDTMGTPEPSIHGEARPNQVGEFQNLQYVSVSHTNVSKQTLNASSNRTPPLDIPFIGEAKDRTVQSASSSAHRDQTHKHDIRLEEGHSFSKTRPKNMRTNSARSISVSKATEKTCFSGTEISDLKVDKNKVQNSQDSYAPADKLQASSDVRYNGNGASPGKGSVIGDNKLELAGTSNENPGPRRPCLKRGDSCFIKRPESQTKNVTFSRPASVGNIFESCQDIKDKERLGMPVSKSGVLDKVESVDENVDNDANEQENHKIRPKETDGSAERLPKKVTQFETRPASSGPSFQSRTKAFEFLQRAHLQRRKSFHADRQSFEADTVAFGINLPKSSPFLIRRDSVLNNKSAALHGAVSRPSSTKQTVEDNNKEQEPFETYVIRNGKLIRRSFSFRSGSAGSVKGDFPGKQCPKSRNQDHRSTQPYSQVEEGMKNTDLHCLNRERSRGSITSPVNHWSYGECQNTNGSTDNFGYLSSSGSSSNTLPTTRPTGAVADSTGAVRHWSSIKQCIISGPPSPMPEIKTGGILLPKAVPVLPDETDISVDLGKDLQKLGFRKGKTGLKKSKKGSNNTTSDEANQKIVINLKEDPMFQKVIKKNRNVAKFASKPESQPQAVCFEIQGTHLTHQDVKLQLEKLLRTCPEVTLDGVQFEHRALVNNCKEMDNRWIISTNSVTGRNRLAGNHLNFDGQMVQLRRYDDVINSEYQQFVRMSNFVKMMNSRNILGSRGK